MKIALIIGSANRGGAELQLVRLAVELHQRGHEVRVLFLLDAGPLVSQLDTAGVGWSNFGFCGLGRSRKALSGMFGVLRLGAELWRWRPDIVHAWLGGSIWLGLGLARLVGRSKRIAAFRGHIPASDMSIFGPIFRSAVKHADAITINAPWLAEEAIRFGASPERIVEIHNAVDIPAEPANVGGQPPTAVVIANFRPYKGHDVLLDAMALVRHPVRVRLLGDGELGATVQMELNAKGLADRMVIVPVPADVAGECRRAQFAIHPSRTEGMSNAILEEMAMGLPVVATDVGAARILIEDGVSGLIVPPGDPAALAVAVERLAADPALRVRMGKEARARVHEFSWETCVERVLALYTSVLADETAEPEGQRWWMRALPRATRRGVKSRQERALHSARTGRSSSNS